jgi:hypothetical protein
MSLLLDTQVLLWLLANDVPLLLGGFRYSHSAAGNGPHRANDENAAPS